MYTCVSSTSSAEIYIYTLIFHIYSRMTSTIAHLSCTHVYISTYIYIHTHLLYLLQKSLLVFCIYSSMTSTISHQPSTTTCTSSAWISVGNCAQPSHTHLPTLQPHTNAPAHTRYCPPSHFLIRLPAARVFVCVCVCVFVFVSQLNRDSRVLVVRLPCSLSHARASVCAHTHTHTCT